MGNLQTVRKKSSLIKVNFLFGKCHMIIISSLGLDWQNTLFDSFAQAWWSIKVKPQGKYSWKVLFFKGNGLTMNVMLCFPVAEERQVRSGDLKLNLADDIQAGEEGGLTSHSHNMNLWCALLSCFRCQFLNYRETQFHAKTLLPREKFGSMKLWTAWPSPAFIIAFLRVYKISNVIS